MPAVAYFQHLTPQVQQSPGVLLPGMVLGVPLFGQPDVHNVVMEDFSSSVHLPCLVQVPF
jgi:hypothetical protein